MASKQEKQIDNSQDITNRASYSGAEAVSHYPQLSNLHPAETTIFERYSADLKGSQLLDIGVGGGRTTAYLSSLAAKYVGVDYSPGLTAATARRFPDLHIEEGDVRDLSKFADGSFDAIFFSFNGLDYINHDDRLVALREMRRLLHDGGLLIFSSHNREFQRFHKLPWQGRPRLTRTTLRQISAAWHARANRSRLSTHEIVHPEWAIINDDAHGYSMLTYYVSAQECHRQLGAAKFGEVATFNLAGQPTHDDSSAAWLYYSARAI